MAVAALEYVQIPVHTSLVSKAQDKSICRERSKRHILFWGQACELQVELREVHFTIPNSNPST